MTESATVTRPAIISPLIDALCVGGLSLLLLLPLERRLIRGGLYLLLAWHVAWFFRWGFGNTRFGPMLESLYLMMSVLSAVALAAGIAGLALMKIRTGRLPPAKALIAWGRSSSGTLRWRATRGLFSGCRSRTRCST